MIEAAKGLRWLKRRVGMDDVAAYLVQIINKPRQIIALKIWHALCVLLPVKYIAELVEPG